MPYALREFCAESCASLKAKPLPAALDEIAGNLARLLQNPEFIAATFSDKDPPGKRELYRDPDTDFRVLAHVQAPGKEGAPHSHGNSWAVYGNAMNSTDMTEYSRVNDESADEVVLRKSARYSLTPGMTRGYGPGVIHSTAHPEKAWVVRVTGTDLDHVPRFHFKRTRDKVLEEA